MGLARNILARTAQRLTDALAPNSAPLGDIETRLCLPVCEETTEESGAIGVFREARDMARQGDWDEVAALITVHDRARDMTPGGTPLAELVSAGARSDISLALKSAARHGHLTERHRSVHALKEVCADLDEAEGGYGGDLLLADTLMDAGWAWYQQGSYYQNNARHVALFREYFDRAADVLAPHCPLEQNAPALAAAKCALLAGEDDASARVLDDYEDLIDLNPRAPGHLRALGIHLMPQWFGSFEAIDSQARKACLQTRDVWGQGAYAWVWLDVLTLEDEAFSHVDMGLFLEAIDDILARRSSQHFVNLFASYLTRFLNRKGSLHIRAHRTALQRRRAGLIRGRLEEVHPWVWATGSLGDAMTLHMAGHDTARDFDAALALARGALSEVFANELNRNKPARSALA